MKPFAYLRPRTREELRGVLARGGRLKGGGLDVLDLAKGGVDSPALLVDLRDAGFLRRIEVDGGGGLRIGGGVTLAAIAASPEVADLCPALADAAAGAATPQIRNVATLAGNLLQRPRCPYFRDPFFDCLKRGGTTCPSMEGEHREGAVLGNGLCAAVHPSNLAPVLAACDGMVALLGPEGEPTILPGAGFFVRPEEDPLREARVGSDQVLEQVRFAPWPISAYEEIDARRSFDWAAASCAAVLSLRDGKVSSARIVLGAVAPVPWRAEAAEAALLGKVPDAAAAAAAGEAAARGAAPLRDNGHKVPLLKVAVKRAILKAAGRA